MMTKRAEYKKMVIGKERKKYTVWVGGAEVTDHFVTYTEAKGIQMQYTVDGYNDAVIEEGR